MSLEDYLCFFRLSTFTSRLLLLLLLLDCLLVNVIAGTLTGADGFTWGTAATAGDVAACQALRRLVFVHEQLVPADVEIDGQDDDAIHVMCHYCANNKIGNSNNEKENPILVATGRVLLVAQQQPDDNDDANPQAINSDNIALQAKLGRIAVHPDFRGQGLGRAVVAQLEDAARQEAMSKQEGATIMMIRCSLTPHAYLHDFYARLGYTVVPGTSLIRVNEHVTLVHMEKVVNAQNEKEMNDDSLMTTQKGDDEEP